MFRWALGTVNYIQGTSKIIEEMSQLEVHNVMLVLEVHMNWNNEFLVIAIMLLIS